MTSSSTVITLCVTFLVCFFHDSSAFERLKLVHRPPTSSRRAFLRLRSSLDASSEFDLLQRTLYNRELEAQQASWLGSVSSLPFECTSCGKCCRTIGNVFMSPEEVAAAADYVNLTATEFIDTYAENKMDSPTKQDDIPWILVKNQETEEGSGCVFLDNETNFCKIYPVRPIQCSTYPFWTNIMESEYHWNTEVRRADDDLSSSLPAWSLEDGGCEGMKILDEENTSLNTEDGVAMKEALEQLSLYQRTDRRLPREGDFETI